MRWVLATVAAAAMAMWAVSGGVRERAGRVRASPSPSFAPVPEEGVRGAVSGPRRVSGGPPPLVAGNRLRVTLERMEGWNSARRPGRPPAWIERALRDALRRNHDPLPRQQLVFLALRLLPAERAKALLRELDDPADREDVILALAFNGDPEARGEFAELAKAPSPANVRQLIDTLVEIERIEALGNEDARDILRSYRALEVLWRRFYFRLVEENVDIPSVPHRARDHALDEELLPRWLARYPGHPGSDDVALVLGEGRSLLWLNRATVLPDQRRTSRALRGFVGYLERAHDHRSIKAMLEDPDTPNRILLEYIRARRIAAFSGFAEGLEWMESVVRGNPHSTLALGWRARHGAPRPDVRVPRLGHVHDRIAGSRARGERLSPTREAMELSVPALAYQFRCWEELVELEDRPVATAAYLLRHPEAVHPVYAIRSFAASLPEHVHGWSHASMLLENVPGARAALLRCDALAEPFAYLTREEARLSGYSVREVVEAYETLARDFPGTVEAQLATEAAWRLE